MEELKTELTGEINTFIRSGFYDKDEVLENIEEMFGEEELDEDWLETEIERLYDQRFEEQAAWAKETDFDRLAKVFDKLNSSGILALHNRGYTRQDGRDDSEQLHEELLESGISTRGYCYYTTQDMDDVIEGDHLYLAFGDFEDDDSLSIGIGKEIVAALNESGFKCDWNISAEDRIKVTGFKWLKRFGNENCSNERAISILSKTS